MNKQIFLAFCATISFCIPLLAAGGVTSKDVVLYKQSRASIDMRVADLLSRMTLEEKVLQLSQYIVGLNTNVNNTGEVDTGLPDGVGSYIYFSENAKLRNALQRKAVENTRLGIPILFGFDVIHGFRTIYPIPLAQGCSWNPKLVSELSAIAARESRMSGTDWTFSPMIDVARDGRWGRVAEGYGEDPYTNAIMGVAAVRGYQGDTLSSKVNVAACLKHFAGYGRSEGGRDYTATDVSRQSLWETYLPPYEACIKAGAATVMSAFNDISGTPATANYYLLTEVLKKRWCYQGFVVSDWNAVEQLIPQGVAANRKEAARKAFLAGLDMDMKDDCFREHLATLVSEGKIDEKKIDESVARVLYLKFQLGLFEDPYTPVYEDSKRILRDEYKEVAARMAQESMVLLKNDNNLLPLKKGMTLALIGPMAKDKENLLGSWKAHGRTEDVESIYEGIEKEFDGHTRLLYAKGCEFDGDDTSLFVEASSVASQADVVILCLGEKSAWSGENASRSTIALPSIQEQLAAELYKTGTPVVILLSNGRPLELARLEQQCDAMLEMWQPGIAGGTPLAQILSGRANPSGKLCITFPLTSGQIPIYYNERQSSRPDQGKYQDIPTTPMYDFVYGLSYTTFAYGKLHASSATVQKNNKVKVEVPITNTGNMDGYETVHWFVSDPYCSISRPQKELKYFEKRFLKKGQTVLFSFEIDPQRDFIYIDETGNRFLEEGEYYVMVKDQKVKIEIK
ncbi:glycoside hydrolase family 3 N-terminal domain-containing protein [Bacteroides sp.]|uniref:glycoside hydrolase family 3 N-terminal domain-containing protein n=1 Tax=Bacteroides sp. TaxID=29523 RepID=UPI00260591D6|nr:glycoside hydrolase family 3 N-terminal domain-containing protein [Bacteroides sp.]